MAWFDPGFLSRLPRLLLMPVRAVLFDFDGVLADTENLHVTAWERTFARLGWDVDPDTCARAAEEDDRDFLHSIFAERKLLDSHADLDGYLQAKQRWMRQLLADRPRLYPGVESLIGRLKGSYRLAVVTTTWRENVEIALGAANLLGAFDRIISKDDGVSPKPAPDLYRLALEKLRLKPVSALAVEDSPAGIASAREAGIAALAVGHRRAAGQWSRHAIGYVDGLTRMDEFYAAARLTPA
jgi:HAD superfamily hydrolase (TIGR01509 family)